MDISIAQGDITKVKVDAIVNAANSSLLGGGGVDGAIHRAGGPEILQACKEIRADRLPDGLPTGDAVATTAGRLPATWVIHTVGPVHAKKTDRTELLRACYRNALAVADEVGARTVAFPLVSAGVYGWPKEDAIVQALTTLTHTPTRVERATLVLFDHGTRELAERVRKRLVAPDTGTDNGDNPTNEDNR